MFISIDVEFLNKSLAVMFLLELPDDKTCAMYPATFHFKALVSEVSHIWNVWGYSFHLRKKNLSCAPSQGLERWNTFPVEHQIQYLPSIPKAGEVRGQRQFSGLEKADGLCVRGDLCLQSDQTPIPFLSLFMTNNTIVQEREAQGLRLTPSITTHEDLVNFFGWGKASRTSLLPEYGED